MALRNLLENACRHGGANARVVLRVAATQVVVEDDGPGFPAEILALATKPFSVAPSRGGAGIGLATAKLVARLHGGELELENPRDGGARATLRLA